MLVDWIWRYRLCEPTIYILGVSGKMKKLNQLSIIIPCPNWTVAYNKTIPKSWLNQQVCFVFEQL